MTDVTFCVGIGTFLFGVITFILAVFVLRSVRRSVELAEERKRYLHEEKSVWLSTVKKVMAWRKH